jgi:hypothetical protein
MNKLNLLRISVLTVWAGIAFLSLSARAYADDGQTCFDVGCNGCSSLSNCLACASLNGWTCLTPKVANPKGYDPGP